MDGKSNGPIKQKNKWLEKIWRAGSGTQHVPKQFYPAWTNHHVSYALYSDLVRIPAAEGTSWSCIPSPFHSLKILYHVPVARSLHSENLVANRQTKGFVNEESKSDNRKSWGVKDVLLCVTSIQPNMCVKIENPIASYQFQITELSIWPRPAIPIIENGHGGCDRWEHCEARKRGMVSDSVYLFLC